MELSITNAASMANVSRTTLYNDMDAGKLSFTSNAKNKRVINVAELERVYGPLKTKEEGKSRSVNTEQNLTNSSSHTDAVELAGLKKQIEMLETERRREREQMDERLSEMSEALKRSQDGQNNLTLLLENKEQDNGGEWERAMKALEQRIANQEKAAQEKEEREQKILRQNQVLRKALDAEKKKLAEEQKKSFLQKLFG
jgi:hypothetical protein